MATAAPPPRSLAELMAHPDEAPRIEDGDAAVMIPLLLDSGRTVRVNLTLDAGLLDIIDTEPPGAAGPDPPSWPARREKRPARFNVPCIRDWPL